MTETNVLKDLFEANDSRKRLTIFLTFLVVVVIYQSTVFWVILQDDIQSKYNLEEFTIEFEESSQFSEESRVINDGEKATLEFSAPAEMFNTHSGFGMLFLNITYAETSGEALDPCDTVSADLTPTGATAEWDNENNVLSGVSSDCETISLQLHVFPSYNGTSQKVTGMDEQYWINYWQDNSHGQGTFNLDVEVIVNQPPTSGLPTISDDNEEITVTWEAVFFNVIVN